MSTENKILQKGINARNASRLLVKLNTSQKDNALALIAEEIELQREAIKTSNKKDLIAGKKRGLTKAFIERLELNDRRINEMIKILHDVSALKDPVGEIIGMNTMPNGLRVGQMRMPLGVIGIIFESRPNVCIEVASLTIKSGNGVILRGGSDALNSNIALVAIIKKALKRAGLPETAVEIIEDTNRESIKELVRMREYIDVIIPRGGLNLIRFIEEHSLIPVIRHDLGICHTYVDEFANLEMAITICFNAKVQRPSVCNAMETLLVHEKVAKEFLPRMKKVYDKSKVELRGCDRTQKILSGIKAATEEDWSTEYLDLILAVKIVNSAEEAIEHINTYSSHHSDAIVSENFNKGMQFLTEVDSAACYINASTRFTDGNEFGLGAEMGISNQKLHVRGPMGLKELTSPKYIVFGNGQIRE
jgi:glutamate-5-semialdehyde dehydrogenase